VTKIRSEAKMGVGSGNALLFVRINGFAAQLFLQVEPIYYCKGL
jgi:hypothetical protein